MIGRSALVVPTPAKSRARVKFMAEQVSSLEAWRIPESSSRTVKASSTIHTRERICRRKVALFENYIDLPFEKGGVRINIWY